MPPKAKTTKQDIIKAGFLAVKQGNELNARSLATSLGVSTQPIFTNYASMNDLKEDIKAEAKKDYEAFLEEFNKTTEVTYKNYGLGYIKYANKEKNLFKLLFMQDRHTQKITDAFDDLKDILSLLKKQTGFDDETCFDLHISQWIFVHGLASMIATDYLDWDEEAVSAMLTIEFNSKVNYINSLRMKK